MAVSLIATVADATANSYVDVTAADAYFANLLSFDQWDDLDADTKARSLITATGQLEELDYCGTQYTTDQALRFPRYYPGVSDGLAIPAAVVAACCEHALVLATNAAAGLEPDADRQQMRAEGVLSWSIGSRSESLAPLSSSSSTEASAAQFSPRVQRLLKGWIRGAYQITSGRRPSYPNGNYDRNGSWWPTELL